MKILILILSTFIYSSYSLKCEWELVDYIKVSSNESKIYYNDNSLLIIDYVKDTLKIVNRTKNELKTIDTSIIKLWDIYDITELNDFFVVTAFTKILLINKTDFSDIRIINQSSFLPYTSIYQNSIISYGINSSNGHARIGNRSIVERIYSNITRDTLILNDPFGVYLCDFTTRKNISFFNGIIAVSDLAKYNINFFDLNLNLIDNLSYNHGSWMELKEEIPSFRLELGVSPPFHLLRRFNTEISQIWLTNFINDSTLLVTWSIPKIDDSEGGFTHFHDLWIYDKKWELIETIDDTLSNDLKYSLDFENIEIGQNYYVKNNYLYIIKPFPLDFVKNNKNTKKQVFHENLNEYYISNELEYTCFIYKYIQ